MVQCLHGVAIPPSVLRQFEVLFKGQDQGSFALRKSEKTLRKLLGCAKPVDIPEPEQGMVRFSFRQWLFVVDEKANLLVRVNRLLFSDLRGKKCPIDLTRIHFTKHSIQRFVERYKSVPNPQKTMIKLLSQSREEDAIGSLDRVMRMIDNKFMPARYLVFECWRFVIVEEDGIFTIVTFEEVCHK